MKLDAQLAKLTAQLETERARYKAAAAAAVAAVLVEYGLTIDDLTPTKKAAAKQTIAPKEYVKAVKAKKVAAKATKANGKRKAPFKGPQPPKYRDPDSGATWSGFGHAPGWIAGVTDRTPYLINGAA